MNAILRRSPLIIVVMILIWFAIALAAARFAKLNLDEPWYLTASHRVIHGYMPYRDFAYTQGPVLPYFYGLGLGVLGTDLQTGRFISVWLSTLSVALACVVARRIGGNAAVVLTFFSILLSPGVVYYLVILKTYALTTTLILLAVYLMFPSRRAAEWFHPFASTLFAGIAAGTRISFVPVAMLVFGFWIFKGKWRPSILGMVVVAGLLFPIIVASPGNFAFDVWEFHWRRGGTPPAFPEFSKPILAVQTLFAFSPAVILGFVLSFHLTRASAFRGRIAEWWKMRFDLKTAWLGVTGYLWAVHFVMRVNDWEYQVPSYLVSIPLLASAAVVIGRAVNNRVGFSLLLSGLLIQAAILAWVFSAEYRWESEDLLVATHRRSEVLRRHGTPGDIVLGVFNHTGLEAGMAPPHGNEMGLFSVTVDMLEDGARRSHLLTELDVTRLLSGCEARFVITDAVGVLFYVSVPSIRRIDARTQARWQAVLESNYDLIFKDTSVSIYRLVSERCARSFASDQVLRRASDGCCCS